MWIFTPIGGYSVVNRHRNMNEDSPSGELMVRSRSTQDLNNLKKAARRWNIDSIADAEIIRTPDNDYACRIFVPIEDWQTVLVRLSNISYPNFKNEAARVNGYESFYASFILPNIWSTWRGSAQEEPEQRPRSFEDNQPWPASQALPTVSNPEEDICHES